MEDRIITVINCKINHLNGKYRYYNDNRIIVDKNSKIYRKDSSHYIYKFNGVWKIGNYGKKIYCQINNYSNDQFLYNTIDFGGTNNVLRLFNTRDNISTTVPDIDTLISYVYHESSTAKDNLTYFLKNGDLKKSNIQLLIIVQGDEITVDIPDHVILLHKENHGLDFEGWAVGLEYIKKTDIWDNLKWFIFMNDTVKGPFIPRWFPKHYHWTECFIDKLDVDTRLVGLTSSYNTCFGFSPHIQSMLWVTDLIGLNIVYDKGLFCTNVVGDKEYIINNYELKLTHVMLEEGYNFYAMNISENINYRKFKEMLLKSNKSYKKHIEDNTLSEIDKSNILNGDIQYPNEYYGHTLSPFELLFIKSNRINGPYEKFISLMTDIN